MLFVALAWSKGAFTIGDCVYASERWGNNVGTMWASFLPVFVYTVVLLLYRTPERV